MACVLHCSTYNANDTRARNRYRKPVPEILYRFSAGVSCESVSIFSSTEMWYGVEQCSTRCRKPWQKWRVLIGQTIASCVVCLYKLCCLLFYYFKMDWGDSSIEKNICRNLLPVSSSTKKLVPENWYGFSVPVSGACVIGITLCGETL